jgi:C4-dicarboxylate transporter DctQ subunit
MKNVKARINSVDKISKILAKIEELSVLISVIITTIAIFLNVVMRNIFQFPLSWPDEVGRYLLIYIIFYGYIIAVRRESEIKVDIIHRFFPHAKRFLSILSYIASIIFSGGLIILGFKYMLLKYRLETKSIILEFPIWILPLIFLVIGGVVMAYRYSEKILEEFKKN